jgi:tetratricopeptide (TPR) repeat protein
MVANRRPLAVLIVALSGCGFASPVHASDWPVPRGPSHEPVPYRYDPGQWKHVPKAFLEDASACTLYAGLNYLIEEDGTVETITHEIVRFNGRKGIDKLGEYRSISYSPAFQKLTLNEARVLKGGGQVVPIEPRDVQLRDVSTDYQVYDRDKQLVISFPSLEVGDVIEVKWTTRGKNPEYQGQFFTRYVFGDERYPVVLDEFRVRLPKSRTLKYAAVGGRIEPAIREEGDYRTYEWRATNQRELTQDEYTPSKEELRVQVAISTFASWEEVGRWKQRLRADCWQCTPAIRQVVRDMTKDLKTPADKARALTYWVRRHIRYVSLGEKHDYTPHLPARVLESRFGDCKDQSQLLAVMLREAGVPVALATLGARDDGQVLESVPSPWGTHAILLATIDGKEHWIDTTASLFGWDFLPRDDRDRLTYVVDEHGLRLVRTPGLTPELNRVEQTTRLTIGADGSSHSERTSVSYGLAAASRREDWTEVPPGERRRIVASELQDANAQTRLRRLVLDERQLQDFDQPVTARMEFDTPGHFSGETDREGSLTDSKIWAKLLAYNLDFDREVALEMPAPFESVHRYVVQLPPAFRLDGVPADKTVHSAWGSFARTLRSDPAEPRRIEVEFRTRLEKIRVERADFDEFRKFHEEVLKHYRVWLTLKRTHDLADVQGLEALLALTPGDSASAQILARLYEFNGLRREARRVVQRARSYNPDDTALWELTVELAETREEEEAAYRELLRRFPEEPKYAVALGAARVDRGDYAGAKAVLEPITRKGPAALRGAAHYHLARGYLAQNLAASALTAWEAAERADPDSVHNLSAWQLQGRIQEKLGRGKEAAAAYQQALRLEPDAPETLLALIRLALAAKDTSGALDYLRRYTVTIGNDLEGLVKAADFYLRLGHSEEALDLANRARDLGFHAGAQRTLGLIYLQRGEYTKAVFHLDRADADAEVVEGLIRGRLALGQLREAERVAERADKVAQPTPALRRTCALVIALSLRRSAVQKEIRVPPAQASAWDKALDSFVCAEQAHADGRPAGQVATLVAGAFADGAELGAAYGLRGLLSLEKGRLSKALSDAERAVALSPLEARGHYVRGRVLLERGADGALADLTRAAELSRRQDAAILHWLAAALFREGNVGEALKTQQEAVKLQPRDQDLLDQLRELERAAKPAGVGP